MTIQRFAFIIFFFGSIITYAFWPSEGKPKTLPDLIEQPPLLEHNPADLAAIRAAADADNPVNFLRDEVGDTVETNIRNWFRKINRPLHPSATIKIVKHSFSPDGDTIRQEIADPNSPSGKKVITGLIYGNHLFALIEGDPNFNGEYMLECLNGMTGDKLPVGVQTQDYGQIDDGVTTILPGGSVCGTLGLTWQAAKNLADQQRLQSYWKKGKFYVMVQPGDGFQKIGGSWRFVPAIPPPTPEMPAFPENLK